jgi:gluconolactonase
MSSRDFRIIAEGLRFPEGPAVLPDGSLAFVEVAHGTLMRLSPDGRLSQMALLGGGPNGVARGPDGALYVCNNGGFEFLDEPGMLRPIGTPQWYQGGSIQRVEPETGEVTTLYGGGDGPVLKGPNDLVFDRSGNFWFTDMGKTRDDTIERARVFYASRDGKSIRLAINHMLGANGIALSPDETKLYVAETVTGRLWQFDITGPGEIRPRAWPSPHGGELLYGSSRYQFFDSMAIEANGNICVGTLLNGGITVVSPDGKLVEHVPTPDVYATNLCFGGEGASVAYITLSTTGRIAAMPWPRAGRMTAF